MACDISTIQAQACTSGIGRIQNPIQLYQLIAQLTCEASQAASLVLFGEGAPIDAPSTTNAVYTNTLNGDKYTYYGGSWHAD